MKYLLTRRRLSQSKDKQRVSAEQQAIFWSGVALHSEIDQETRVIPPSESATARSGSTAGDMWDHLRSGIAGSETS